MMTGSLHQLCACGHPHVLDDGDVLATGWVPACPACGCDDFQLHPGAVAAAERRQAADRAEYGARAILPPDLVEGFLSVLNSFEEHHEQVYGWDAPPLFGVLLGGKPQRTNRVQRDMNDAKLQVMPVEVLPLRLDHSFWSTCGGDPVQTVSSLAKLCERSSAAFDDFRMVGGLDPATPVIGWLLMFEVYLSNAETGERYDELRTLSMVDLDERVYGVQRQRSNGRRASTIASLREQAAYVEQQRAAGEDVPQDQKLPAVTDALVRLTRLSRLQNEVAATLRDVE